MQRYLFSLLLLITFHVDLLAAVTTGKPNIVLLYADDAGYADFNFQPNAADDIRNLTPNIDRIASQGARFTNAYMSGTVCAPSRAGLLTGRYQQRFGFDNNLRPANQTGLPLTETLGTKYLQDLGYRTALIGKWHLGYAAAFHPNQRGFDWFYGLLGGSRPYFPAKEARSDQVLQSNGKPTPEKGYVTDRLGDAACRFILRSGNQPYFLLVSFTAPHGPLQAKPQILKQLSSIKSAGRRKYVGLIVSLDENVGKILTCLQQANQEERTLVVFTNDNGGQTLKGANNYPLHGKKRDVWEGGIRVPWVMRWPGKINSRSVIDDPVIALDLLPTFINAAGGTIDPDWQLDGVSLLSRITKPNTTLSERALFWRHCGSEGKRAMRRGHWKVVHNRHQGVSPMLFNLHTDIGEENNLANNEVEMLHTMLDLLDTWESELTEPLWGRSRECKLGI
ncbi:MAG: sulfatase [Gammaproteobacteria bacterium]|nr:MAG: sulfatase [Gammaproteobacteria bacterium]